MSPNPRLVQRRTLCEIRTKSLKASSRNKSHRTRLENLREQVCFQSTFKHGGCVTVSDVQSDTVPKSGRTRGEGTIVVSLTAELCDQTSWSMFTNVCSVPWHALF